MTFHQSIDTGCREVAEIDRLQRALRNLRHWSTTVATRRSYVDDRGRRLFATAAGLREAAWLDCLHAAYGLFEIDAIHRAWTDAGGRGA
ncbi:MULTISPECIES: hypothetical protein [unclassified Sphingomonas]|uniref:hypothetical protein n=1 Tax=unclassified Sphingomonas TaxID=196159 RepID=UPI0006F447A8|nr:MULTISPECIES: hypothetical protein [unclassified Sphingomonas]KQX17989.1 hypothetical protein ASD17_20060 [Sphingomonas sp. Root1294]KQY70914.1 hypothetical protein ASD39_23960 [Sphingomonas sp. Root50]KRB91590.1 hypothetical protein ASE22_06350 [Sphingomonas sp. Root720]